MRPRTLRRRGRFYHRKRGRWRLSLALALIGVALAGFVVVDLTAGPPLPGPAQETSNPIAASALTTHAPARATSVELGSTKPVPSASAPVSTSSFRRGRSGFPIAGPARDANRRGFDAAARLDARPARDVNAAERVPVPQPLAQRAQTPPDDVPF